MLVRVMRIRPKTFALVVRKEEFASVFSPGIIAKLVDDKSWSCREPVHWESDQESWPHRTKLKGREWRAETYWHQWMTDPAKP